MYHPCSENKGADQLCSYWTADLHLCFRICRLLVLWWYINIFVPTSCFEQNWDIICNCSEDISFCRHTNESMMHIISMSCLMRKPTICICEICNLHLCENKDADQLRGNREADQRLCFRYTDSTKPLLLKSKISSFKPASVTVQSDLYQTYSETTFLTAFPETYTFRGVQWPGCWVEHRTPNREVLG